MLPDEIAAAGCPNAKLVPDWSTEQASFGTSSKS